MDPEYLIHLTPFFVTTKNYPYALLRSPESGFLVYHTKIRPEQPFEASEYSIDLLTLDLPVADFGGKGLDVVLYPEYGFIGQTRSGENLAPPHVPYPLRLTI